MNRGGSKTSSTARIPQFLVDDTKKVIESILSTDMKEVDSRVQTSVNEIARDVVEDIVKDILDGTAKQMVGKSLNELEPEQLLTQVTHFLKMQAREELDKLIEPERESATAVTPRNDSSVSDSFLHTPLNDAIDKISRKLSCVASK